MADVALKAFLLGGLAASSLIVGALLALVWKPVDRVLAAIMAFGAGVLLSALAFELVAEAAARAGFFPMASGAVLGGLVFVGLDRLLSGYGAFLRKTSTTKKVLRDEKRARAASMIERLSRVEILRSLPPEEVQALVSEVDPHHVLAGGEVFRQGDVGDALYMIDEGQVDIVKGDDRAHPVATLGPGDAFGEMALLTGEPRSATALAKTDVKLLAVNKDSFDRLLKSSPRLSLAVGQLLARRLGAASDRVVAAESKQWQEAALKNVAADVLNPTAVEVRASASTHAATAMAIWLGSLLDGIPESLVIGASTRHDRPIGLAFFVGVLVCNFPESLSSGVIMRRGGFSSRKVLGLWTAVIVISALVAWVGNVLCAGLGPTGVAMIEGAGAGALLVMVAETMLPEAYEQGESVVGLATLVGFLTAFFVNGLAR